MVRITELRPHPNADRLEFAALETQHGPSTYQVIVQKGQFKPGDLAGYFGVDCVVPLDRPEFAFLKDRQDGANKTTFRLRAARFRGEFSQGLLVTLSGGNRSLGQDLSREFGVSYHVVPERGSSLPAGAPKLKKPQPMPVYGVESLKKVSRLFTEDEPLYITEKIHGTNFRFGWVRRRILGIPMGWRFIVGSHNVIKDAQAGPGFYGHDLWTDYARENDLAARTKDFKGYFFYGELYGCLPNGKAIQSGYTYGRKDVGLVVFDILGPSGWLAPLQRRFACEDLGLPTPPLLTASYPHSLEAIKLMAEGPSHLDSKTTREGVVVECYQPGPGPRRKAKYVGEGYLEIQGKLIAKEEKEEAKLAA